MPRWSPGLPDGRLGRLTPHAERYRIPIHDVCNFRTLRCDNTGRGNETMADETSSNLTPEQMAARIADLEGRLAKGSSLSFKVSEKGGVSVYGLGRFPVTLYSTDGRSQHGAGWYSRPCRHDALGSQNEEHFLTVTISISETDLALAAERLQQHAQARTRTTTYFRLSVHESESAWHQHDPKPMKADHRNPAQSWS
jgi:hypothetical protein